MNKLSGGALCKINKIILIIILIPLSMPAQIDIEGSRDHRLVPRIPGSIIVFYNETENGIYKYTLGPLVRSAESRSYSPTDTKDIEGRITRIQYRLEEKNGFQRAVDFYEKTLKDAGFDLTAYVKADKPMDVAGRNWMSYVYSGLPERERSNIGGTRTGTENRYFISGQITHEDQQVLLIMIINEFDEDEVYIQVDVTGPEIDLEKNENNAEIADAETIANTLNKYGHIAIYGIYFETDKAEILKESEPALEQIAEYILDNSGAVLYVVGHTDMRGNPEFRIALSKSRADAVVYALVSRYPINPERLLPRGVGPLSPVATNKTDEGRKKNNRIDLVLKTD